MKRDKRRVLGFTLVEIMIVVTIIGILASLAVPAFQRARWKALETSIRNNLRQMWGAAQQYMLENGVDQVDMMEIVKWEPKKDSKNSESSEGGTSYGKHEGYTSVLQQISSEKYNEILAARDDETLDPSSEDQDAVTGEAGILYADTTGIEIEVSGSSTTGKWVKLVL